MFGYIFMRDEIGARNVRDIINKYFNWKDLLLKVFIIRFCCDASLRAKL